MRIMIDPYGEIRTIYADLPYSVRGTCYHDAEGHVYILINARMSRHILRGDMYNTAYHEYGGPHED